MALLVSLLPVTAFLLLLVVFDSFKLVPRLMIVRAMVMGALGALLLLPIHAWLLDATGFRAEAFSRYVAPLTEETIKALCLLYPLRKREIGFLVDAAIVGFAIGAGFALVENLEYLSTLGEPRLLVWIVRGFGTAVLHATTTAIVAITAKSLGDRFPARGWLVVLPGWVAAVLLHAAYNHALVSPVLAAALLVFVLPLVVIDVFGRSEKMTREWVGSGLDLDVELLQLVTSTEFGGTRLGKYLEELTTRFPGPVVADMFCLLQLDLELSIRAKGMLMAREAGLDLPVGDDLKDRLAERQYLHGTIGPTGLLALRPLQMTSHRDDWHQYLLKHARK